MEAKGLTKAADYAVHLLLDDELRARTAAIRGGPDQSVGWSAVLALDEVELSASEARHASSELPLWRRHVWTPSSSSAPRQTPSEGVGLPSPTQSPLHRWRRV